MQQGVTGSGLIAQSFLTSALDGGEGSATHHGRFTAQEGAPGTHCTEDRVSPWTGLRAAERTKNLIFFSNIEPSPSSP
jgi:hypothetical protein